MPTRKLQQGPGRGALTEPSTSIICSSLQFWLAPVLCRGGYITFTICTPKEMRSSPQSSSTEPNPAGTQRHPPYSLQAEHQRLPTTSSNAGALCNHHTVASMQSCPHRVTLPPTSPLLSTNTISNRCTLVHGTGAEGFFPPAKAWGPHVPPPHRGLSSPKPPRCGVRGGIPISKGAKLGLEGARQPRVQETLLQEAELLCWKERSEISKREERKRQMRVQKAPCRTGPSAITAFCFHLISAFSGCWKYPALEPSSAKKKRQRAKQCETLTVVEFTPSREQLSLWQILRGHSVLLLSQPRGGASAQCSVNPNFCNRLF